MTSTRKDFISAKVKMASSQKDHALVTASLHLGMIWGLKSKDYVVIKTLHTPICCLKFCLHQINSFPLHQGPCLPQAAEEMIALLSQHTTESGVLPTPDLATSIGHVGSNMETPSTWYEEGLGFENTVVSDIPEFDNFAGDLSFLDQDDDTPIEPWLNFCKGSHQ